MRYVLLLLTLLTAGFSVWYYQNRISPEGKELAAQKTTLEQEAAILEKAVIQSRKKLDDAQDSTRAAEEDIERFQQAYLQQKRQQHQEIQDAAYQKSVADQQEEVKEHDQKIDRLRRRMKRQRESTKSAKEKLLRKKEGMRTQLDRLTDQQRSIQAELEHNQRIIADFGKQQGNASWQDGEFKAANGVKFLACGRGQSPRGLRDREARPDYIVIDDLDDDELCRNEKRVHDITDWVKEALFGALDVGRGRFIMVGNLISKNSVLANLTKTKGVHVSVIKAIDKNGEPVWREKWTKEEAQEYRDFVGYRAWEKEMMHNPIVDGTIFRADWIRYKKLPRLSKYEMLVCYTDPSFKSTTSNDYKACRLWGKIGSELHLIDAFVRQATVSEMVRWLYDLYERTRDTVAVQFFMEANFMQDVILDEFAVEGNLRGYQLPIMPDKRKKPDKIQRIEAVSPLWERGFVFYNERKKDDPDMQVGIEQTLALERGSRVHDDAPDADEGAIWILQRNTRQESFKPVFGKRPTAKNIW